MFDRFFSKLKAAFSRKQKPPKSYIIKGPDGRYRGEVKEGVFYIERYNTKTRHHFFYKYGGYSASLDTLNDLNTASVRLIHLLEHRDDGDREFWSALPDWFEHGSAYTNKQTDHQRILPMSYQYEKRAQAEARVKV